MALKTLLGQVSDEQLKKLPGRVRSPERVQQHLDAFGLHLQGVSLRGIAQHFGWKAVSTAENSVKRGEMLARNLNLDTEKIRLKLAAYFDEILEITMEQVKQQVKDGRVTVEMDSEGNRNIRKTAGVDPRLLGEAGRGAIRFAEFVGLMNRAPEVNQATTLIQLNAPSDGADFAEKWGQPQAEIDVDAREITADDSCIPSDAAPALTSPTDGISVDACNG